MQKNLQDYTKSLFLEVSFLHLKRGKKEEKSLQFSLGFFFLLKPFLIGKQNLKGEERVLGFRIC